MARHIRQQIDCNFSASWLSEYQQDRTDVDGILKQTRQIKWLISIVLVLQLMPGSALAAPYIQSIQEAPGDLVDIGSLRMHIHCVGDRSPTVVLDSGMGGFSLDWLKVQSRLADHVRVCAYDRAGYGWSEQGPSPRITEQIVDELHELLKAYELEPPYILVGHSFGGYNMQYYAKVYPKKTAGLVLVESSHPDQADRMPDIPAVRERASGARMISMFDPSFVRMYPEDYRDMVLRIFSTEKFHFTRQREYLNFTQSGVQVAEIERQITVPMAVITRGKRSYDTTPYGRQQERVWKQLQKELLNISSNSWQIIAEDSGHLVHFSQPELVAKTIMSVVSRYCENQPDKKRHSIHSWCTQMVIESP